MRSCQSFLVTVSAHLEGHVVLEILEEVEHLLPQREALRELLERRPVKVLRHLRI